MPSSRAVLNDLHENGLNPLKPHAYIHNCRLVQKPVVDESKPERVDVTLAVVEPEPEPVHVIDAASVKLTKAVDEPKKQKQKRGKMNSVVD